MKYKNQTEAEITRAIRSMLKGVGIFHYKHWQGQFSGLKGISDIIGIYDGRFLAIEVKTKTGKLSHHQKLFIDRVNREGGIAFIARSIDDVINGLNIKDRFLI